MTGFAKNHPGGKFIDLAAGGDVEAFWRHWHYHFHSPKVADALRSTRIGSLVPDESTAANGTDEDPYHTDPPRDMRLHKLWLSKPFNSETAHDQLGQSYLTPADALYIRNHAPVPVIADGDAHRVMFVYGDTEVACESLSALASRFPQVTVTSILQCAGNRAADDAKSTGPNGFHGTPFEELGYGMVGNVQWSGVRLSDVLPAMFPQLRALFDSAGVDAAPGGAAGAGRSLSGGGAPSGRAPSTDATLASGELHVIFEGADGYESSTPLASVLRGEADCLLATRMNGDALPRDHGFPCRALLPGIAGARNVKWVTCIRLSDRPSEAPWNAHYYKRADGTEVQALPLQSIVVQPARGQPVRADEDGRFAVSGVAYHGAGGAPVAAVEVSADDGASWHRAKLLREEVLVDDATMPHHWIRWVARVPAPHTQAHARVCCRATDADGHAQPRVSDKQRGYLYNGWHSIDVAVVTGDTSHVAPKATAERAT